MLFISSYSPFVWRANNKNKTIFKNSNQSFKLLDSITSNVYSLVELSCQSDLGSISSGSSRWGKWKIMMKSNYFLFLIFIFLQNFLQYQFNQCETMPFGLSKPWENQNLACFFPQFALSVISFHHHFHLHLVLSVHQDVFLQFLFSYNFFCT